MGLILSIEGLSKKGSSLSARLSSSWDIICSCLWTHARTGTHGFSSPQSPACCLQILNGSTCMIRDGQFFRVNIYLCLLSVLWRPQPKHRGNFEKGTSAVSHRRLLAGRGVLELSGKKCNLYTSMLHRDPVDLKLPEDFLPSTGCWKVTELQRLPWGGGWRWLERNQPPRKCGRGPGN